MWAALSLVVNNSTLAHDAVGPSTSTTRLTCDTPRNGVWGLVRRRAARWALIPIRLRLDGGYSVDKVDFPRRSVTFMRIK